MGTLEIQMAGTMGWVSTVRLAFTLPQGANMSLERAQALVADLRKRLEKEDQVVSKCFKRSIEKHVKASARGKSRGKKA